MRAPQMERRPYLERLRLLRAFMAVRRAGDDAALNVGGAPHIVDWRLLVNFVEEEKIDALIEDGGVDFDEARRKLDGEHRAAAAAGKAAKKAATPTWFRGCSNWLASAFAKDDPVEEMIQSTSSHK